MQRQVGLPQMLYCFDRAPGRNSPNALICCLMFRIRFSRDSGETAMTCGFWRIALKRDLNRQLPTIDYAMFAESLAGDEVREGFAAFVEKRPPQWVK